MTFITVCCVAWAIHLFDWRQVGIAVLRMQWGMFVSAGLALIACIFAIRGLRWLAVLGLPFNRRRFLQSLYANGVASGLATLTPFQLGEIVKLRMIPDKRGSAWRLGISAFFVERVLDLTGAIGIGGCGFALHLGSITASAFFLLLPLWSGGLLCLVASFSRRLPARLVTYAKALHHTRGVIGASVLTVLLWLLYAALWWLATCAIHVSLDFSQVSMMLGSVMLAIVATLSPGGVGVAELGSRSIMLWFGKSAVDADAAAIALRLLTPLLAMSGGICFILLKYNRALTERPRNNTN